MIILHALCFSTFRKNCLEHPALNIHSNQPPTTTANLWLAGLIAVAWWLLTRPYMGIWHDGLFYTAQALKHLYPAQYAQDVFFLYGSQDDFSLFSSMHAWLIGWLGIDRAFLFLSLLGAAIWLYALLRLLRRWLAGRQLIAALILVLSADPHYAGFDVFSYGEKFATPRLFAEALVLLSLSLHLENRRPSAWGALAAAAFLHPLIALAGGAVLAWSAMRRIAQPPIVLWAALLVLGVLGMLLLVWVGLTPRLDSVWYQQLELRSPFLFPNLWALTDWLRVMLDVGLLFLAAHYLSSGSGKLASWILPVFTLALLWACFAAWVGIQLPVAAQLARMQWLAHLLALALTVPLCVHLWRSPSVWKNYLALGIVSSLLFPANLGGLILPLIYGLYLWAQHRMPGQIPVRHLSLLLICLPLTGLALWLFNFALNMELVRLFGGQPVWLKVFTAPPVAIGLFVALCFFVDRLHMQSAGLWIYGLCLLAIGLISWNMHGSTGNHESVARAAAISPVKTLIPSNAVVYWESGTYTDTEHQLRLDEGLQHTWFWLQRAQYASFDQAAGGIFFRRTSLELTRRIEHLRKWKFRDDNLDWQDRHKPPQILTLTSMRLRGVCSDPILNYVITDTALPSSRLNFADPLTGRKFSVYDCTTLRDTQHQGDKQ